MAALRLAILPVVVGIALLLAWKLGYFELDRRRQLIETVQRWRMVPHVEPLYVIAYAVAVSLCLPAAVLTLLAGAIFGAWVGALLSWGGSMLATLIAHWLARHIARAPLRRLFGEHRLLKQLREHGDITTLFRLRILPIAPFAVLDYLAGLAGVSMRRLFLATAVGVLPSVIAYSYVGSELLAGLVARGEASRRGLYIAGGITLAMAMVSLVPGIARRLRE
jgi:uncharacterized membrane protein YdjX (TVP38/TMEM64 family)